MRFNQDEKTQRSPYVVETWVTDGKYRSYIWDNRWQTPTRRADGRPTKEYVKKSDAILDYSYVGSRFNNFVYRRFHKLFAPLMYSPEYRKQKRKAQGTYKYK